MRERTADRARLSPWLAVALGAVAVGAIGVLRSRALHHAHGVPGSAPGRTSRRVYFGDYAVVGRTVTINRPRAELYSFWRKFENLGRFMDNVERVETAGDVSTWTVKAPFGRTVTVKTRIASDRENEQIAWRSTAESDIEAEGKVSFRDAPGDRGTEVEAIVAYVPPVGEAGRLIAKLFQREPQVQGRRELKRFKMLMETGEIAVSANRRAA